MMGKKQLCPTKLLSVCKLDGPKRPGNRPGRITVWPRLLIGNSSVNPCNRDRAMVCQIFRCNVVMNSYSLLVYIFLYVHLKFCVCISIHVMSIRFRQEKVMVCLR